MKLERKGRISINFVVMLVLGMMVVALIVVTGQQWLTQTGQEFINLVE